MNASRLDLAFQQIAGTIETRRKGSANHRQVVVGLVGRGIQASRTPRMHELEGSRVGLEYIYVLIDFDAFHLSDIDLAKVVALSQSLGFAGLNITYPFKQAVIPLLDNLAPEAAAIGAVNTLVFAGSERIGHNTDSWGFAESFRDGLAGADLGAVVQFGAGGAGAAVGHALLSLGAKALTLCETDLGRAQSLAGRLTERFGTRVQVDLNPSSAISGATGLVNTTPVGMDKFPGVPFDADALQPGQWVADVIYFPSETMLLTKARALGCRTLGGAGMAVYQAVKAFELFTGLAPDRAAMTAHFQIAA